MYKVFLYNKPIILAQSQKDINKGYADHTYRADTFQDVSHHYFRFEQDRSFPYLAMYSDNLQQLTDHFFSLFEFVKAAGGIVRSGENSYLFIHRRGKWDLPKGKVEQGEDVQYAAIREVEEETGVIAPEIIRELPSTFHIYRVKNKRMLKRTYWYEMYVKTEQPLKPQTVEEISQAVWMTRDQALASCQNTYYSLQELIKGYLNDDL
ncbi:MAG: NUDIX domain-containing protein [Bacteroidales bacterium]|nr:NUDIX domain-containing protein [Bacteroidales bacterium]